MSSIINSNCPLPAIMCYFALITTERASRISASRTTLIAFELIAQKPSNSADTLRRSRYPRCNGRIAGINFSLYAVSGSRSDWAEVGSVSDAARMCRRLDAACRPYINPRPSGRSVRRDTITVSPSTNLFAGGGGIGGGIGGEIGGGGGMRARGGERVSYRFAR